MGSEPDLLLDAIKNQRQIHNCSSVLSAKLFVELHFHEVLLQCIAQKDDFFWQCPFEDMRYTVGYVNFTELKLQCVVAAKCQKQKTKMTIFFFSSKILNHFSTPLNSKKQARFSRIMGLSITG